MKKHYLWNLYFLLLKGTVESINSLVPFSSLQRLQGEKAEVLPKQPTALHRSPQSIIESNTPKQPLQSKQDGEA